MIIILCYIREDEHRQQGPVPTNLTQQCVYNNNNNSDNIRGARWRSSRELRI